MKKNLGSVVVLVMITGRKEISPSGRTVWKNPVGSAVGAGMKIGIYEVSPFSRTVGEKAGTAESDGKGMKGMNVVSPSGEML